MYLKIRIWGDFSRLNQHNGMEVIKDFLLFFLNFKAVFKFKSWLTSNSLFKVKENAERRPRTRSVQEQRVCLFTSICGVGHLYKMETAREECAGSF